jgi:death-on-curing protein
VWTKAAALLQSIVKSHPLVDSNKRLGWLAAATFLEINGVDVTVVSNDDVFGFVVGVAAGRDEIDELAARLRGLAR